MASSGFDSAVASLKTWVPSKTVPNEGKLRLYGLFKQITVGDVNTARPGGFLNFEANAKWDAWNSNKGKGKEESMVAYIAEVDDQKAKYS